MNDLAVIGILAFSILMLNDFLSSFEVFTASLRKRLIENSPDERNIFALLPHCVLVALLQPNPKNYINYLIHKLKLQSGELRSALLSFCLCLLTLWPAFLFASLYLSTNSIFILGIGFVILIIANVSKIIFSRNATANDQIRNLGRMIIGFALVGLSFELTMKWSALIHTWGQESEITYFLADGRFFTLLQMLILGLLLSVLLSYEGWFWVWPLFLYTGGMLSLNGAMALFASGILSGFIVIFIKGRSFSGIQRNLVRNGAIVGALATIVSFLIFGALRGNIGQLGASFEELQNQKLFSLICGWLVILFPTTIALMIWGHFAYQRETVQTSR